MEPMDEDVLPRRTGENVRYGEIRAGDTREMVKAGIAAGNISIQTVNADVMELPQVKLATKSAVATVAVSWCRDCCAGRMAVLWLSDEGQALFCKALAQPYDT